MFNFLKVTFSRVKFRKNVSGLSLHREAAAAAAAAAAADMISYDLISCDLILYAII